MLCFGRWHANQDGRIMRPYHTTCEELHGCVKPKIVTWPRDTGEMCLQVLFCTIRQSFR